VGEAYVEAGADVVEIGVPFSDPLADGPTIQDTTTRALENGADISYCFELAARFSGRVPTVLLIYYNNVFARGAGRFFDEAADAGVSGLVIPDLPWARRWSSGRWPPRGVWRSARSRPPRRGTSGLT
jgi:tryptophan synthase alpha chain